MKNQRLHILTSWLCTNDCIFCMENKDVREFISLEKVEKILKNWLKYSKEVTFTSWEPTLHPNLIDMVSLAKKYWYQVIQVISNWRKYKNYDYAENLIKAWVTDFIISIHSYNALSHDEIVRKKWAFNDVLEWIINISKLKKKYRLVFNTNTTILKNNYKDVIKIVYFLEKFPIDSLVLNIVIPQEEAIKNKINVLEKYSIMLEKFTDLQKFQNKYNNIYINGFPMCLSKDLLWIIWFREPVQFEQWWKYFARYSENQINNINVDNKYKIINWKIKRKQCMNCKYYNDCEWIWDSYIKIYWWNEFIAVN